MNTKAPFGLKSHIQNEVSLSDEHVAAEAAWKQGHGRDPLSVLLDLERQASERYDRMLERRIPVLSRTSYTKLWMNERIRRI